jgi:hypothetical protein
MVALAGSALAEGDSVAADDARASLDRVLAATEQMQLGAGCHKYGHIIACCRTDVNGPSLANVTLTRDCKWRCLGIDLKPIPKHAHIVMRYPRQCTLSFYD